MPLEVTKHLYYNLTMENNMKLRVWWIPQMPMQAFYANVNSVEEGVKTMDLSCSL